MSRFYASIRGSRGEATRQGTKASGISGHVRGWDVGASVHIEAADGDGYEADRVQIYATVGSNGHGPEKLLATFDGQRWEVSV